MALSVRQLGPNDITSWSPADADCEGILSDGVVAFRVFRARNNSQLQRCLTPLEDAYDALEDECEAAGIPLYNSDPTRGWTARHLGCWACYQAKCAPVTDTQLEPFQRFLVRIRDLTKHVDTLLRQEFPEFADALTVCEKQIPACYRYAHLVASHLTSVQGWAVSNCSSELWLQQAPH